ncbi:MAG: amino acid adenylation domain-containing protein [Caulobacterales bacterium]
MPDSSFSFAGDYPPDAIAIVGMAGRFPGAENLNAFWRNLLDKTVSISRLGLSELEDNFDVETRSQSNFVAARPILEDADKFDAEFFGVYAREAELMDPQHRIFLEIAWEALESAGIIPERYKGEIGVFAGASMPTYFLNNVCADRNAIASFTSDYQIGGLPTLLGALPDALATRVAYKLNLRGPALTVQSACSTSLLAVAQACQSLMLYQCDAALAGGVSITFPQKRGYLYQEGGIASRDGACRPFDAEASGTVFGSGAGVVLLKRLEDAIADGDPIFAVIRGTAVNNDGSAKVGFTAPSAEGQARVIQAAHGAASVDAASIGYVELHGTATPLGDPIEFEGLKRAFGDCNGARNFCVLGSAKANVGHLDAAAGVTGLIKTALSLHHEKIPAMTEFKSPNPNIDLDKSPFRISTDATPWPRGRSPRRAGVSSFGVGGTNVHVVLEEAPARAAHPAQDKTPLIFPISARTETAVLAAAARLKTSVEQDLALQLDATARTLQEGRRDFDVRATIVAADREEALTKLNSLDAKALKRIPAKRPHVVFMFPGQGAQYPGMGSALYKSEPVFRDVIDRGANELARILQRDIRDLLYRKTSADENESHEIRSTVFAQPALFLTQYALAKLWMSRGVQPDSMIGHSVGELVAATLAGVMSFEEAVSFVAARASFMQAAPGGAMLAVRTSESALKALLDEGLDIAAINAPSLCVVAGDFPRIAAFERALNQRDIQHRRLHTSHAFHSSMMDDVVAALAIHANGMKLHAPNIPFVSCVTGDWATQDLLTSKSYWTLHCREPVRFADALARLVADTRPVLLEVGPGRTLSTFAMQGLSKASYDCVIASLPEFSNASDEDRVFAEATARLWTSGAPVRWPASSAPRLSSLPTYPFERRSYWIEAPKTSSSAAAKSPEPRDPATLQQPMPPADLSMPEMSESAPPSPATKSGQRTTRLCADIARIIEGLSGEPIADTEWTTPYLEFGFDSLFLGQVAQQIQKHFKIKITFRQLLGDYPDIASLADFLDAAMPADPVAQIEAPIAQVSAAPVVAAPAASAPLAPIAAGGDMLAIFQAQLSAMQNLMDRQLDALGGRRESPSAQSQQAQPAAVAPAPAAISAIPAAAAPNADGQPSRFRMFDKNARTETLTPAQKSFVDALVARVSEQMPKSKSYAAEHRPHLADPRSVSGFRAEWKNAIFPIVASRAKGSTIWDLDGNSYIDLVNGYGQTAFGHSPDFVVEALQEQLTKGFPIGPQSDAAGDVARRIAKMVGLERVTFCNTGSEAVMAAMRVARAVSGRETVVVFSNDYHGQFDEVLVKGARRGAPPRALPISAGIPASAVSNMVVLGYGESESLSWIRDNAETLAAIIVEPVQSRHPELRPVEFLKELRAITAANGAALVFDEVVTGFRTHPGGMQALWGIKADMATYGKVIGGGMPIGILAGTPAYMDALDGGAWQFGDDSVPEVAPIFFAGTFVRHPLVVAAAQAVLTHLETQGAALQQGLEARTRQLVDRLNALFADRGVKTRAETFSSWFMLNFGAEDALGSLFYLYARSLGVNIQEGFPCFITTAHSDADFQRIETVFGEALDALQSVGILGAHSIDASLAPAAEIAALITAPVADLPWQAPLTEMQKEVWLAAQMGDTASCAFNESFRLELDGLLNVRALEDAVNDLVARHDALRAYFGETGEQMFVRPQLELELGSVDVSASGGEDALADILADDARTPFDLVNGPLVRAFVVRLGDNAHVLCFSAHHIVFDGWSAGVVISELAACYDARLAGLAAGLPPAPQYRAYALAQAQQTADTRSAQSFWAGQYLDIPALPDLPADRARPQVRTYDGATSTAFIDEILTRKIKKAGAQRGCTPFATLFTAFQILIGRLANHSDVVVAVPTAGQSLEEDAGLVGHCVNLLPVRVGFDPAAPVADHLEKVKQALLRAFDHQSYTFGTLVRDLKVPRDINRLPLTEVQFNFEKFGGDLKLENLTARVRPNPKAASNFDLFFNVAESSEGLRIDCDFNGDIFDAATIERWMGHYRTILESFVEDLTQPIQSLNLLSRDERSWMVETLNHTQTEFTDLPLHRLFEVQARRTPHAIAAIAGAQAFTYADLDARANQFARYLARRVPGSGKRVAIALDRSLDLLASMLGVLKAGHAYVPLDIDHPPERLRHVLATAQVSALVCHNDRALPIAPDASIVVSLDRDRALIDSEDKTGAAVALGEGAIAYVIFTSGSTGEPKGVEVPHRALTNFLASMARKPGCNANDCIVAVTTVSFDIAALELFLPLVLGARVVIANRDDVRSGFGLLDLINKHRATMLQATPSLWRILLEAGFKPSRSLKMLCGGEPLPRDLADSLTSAPDAELWNMYGPTETTIWSSVSRVGPGLITIGEPIANTQLHILDSNDQLCPLGAPGLLYIGGEGLAKGYFGRRDLTDAAFRFISLNGAAPRRLYNTGDIARRLPDGRIQHLGRADQQIKLRGFRIELEEIETLLRAASGVSEAAVALRDGATGEARLVGYYVPAPGAAPATSDLALHLRSQLPDYMCPTAWVALARMPMTGNGKLDRKALPNPNLENEPARDRVLPVNSMEETLLEIWSDVLGVREISTTDSLFALGADSIHLFRIAARMAERGLPLKAKDVLQNPSIAALAAIASAARSDQRTVADAPSLAAFRSGGRRNRPT